MNYAGNDIGTPLDYQVSLVQSASHGDVVFLENGTLQYTPDMDYCGTDTFSYSVRTTEGYSVARVSLQATGCVVSLLAIDDMVNYPYGQAVTYNVAMNDLGITSSAVITMQGFPDHGQITLYDDGAFLYVPNIGYCGVDRFSYVVTIGQATSVGDVFLSAKNCRDPIVVNPDLVDYPAGKSVLVNVLANDIGFQSADTVYVSKSPQHGSVALSGFGLITYTPQIGYCGMDDFSYAIDNGFGGVAEGRVSVAPEGCGKRLAISWLPSEQSPYVDVAGYRLYMGRQNRKYIHSVDLGQRIDFEYVVDEPGEYYFAITAVSGIKTESNFSDEVLLMHP